jgi:hypothetical protein
VTYDGNQRDAAAQDTSNKATILLDENLGGIGEGVGPQRVRPVALWGPPMVLWAQAACLRLVASVILP